MSNVKKNLVYNSIYQIAIMILPLITAPYISRVIGAEGVGIYSYNYSVALYFVYFATLGIVNYGNRMISKSSDNEDEKNKYFSSIYSFQVIVSCMVFLIYLLYIVFFVDTDKTIPLIMIFHVCSSIFDVSWFFFGMQEFKITSIRQLIIRIVTFLSIFIFVKNSSDLWIYTLIMSLGYFISALTLWIIVWKKVKWIKTTRKEILKHLKPCIILFIPVIATSVYRIMDKIMIGNICDMKQVGYYENAEKLILVTLGIIGAFATVIMPKISNLLANKKLVEANNLFDKSMEYSLLIGMAIAFGIASTSNEFIPIFFGEEFKPSINISIALCLTVPVITWSTIVRNLYLIPYEKDFIYVKSVIIGALLNIIMNFIFIPKFGAFGAIFGTWCAEISLAVYQTFKVRKQLRLKKYLQEFFIFAVFGTIMYIIVRQISGVFTEDIINLAFEIMIGAFVYILLSIVYLIYTNNLDFKNILIKAKIIKGENNI